MSYCVNEKNLATMLKTRTQ